MKKSLLVICSVIAVVSLLQSSVKAPKSYAHASGSSVAGNSGGCTGCHSSGAAPGSVTIIGLPSSMDTGKTYAFSLLMNNGTTSAMKWGFAMSATGGTLSTTNALIGTSTSHQLYHKTGLAKTGTSYQVDSLFIKPTAVGTVAFKFACLAGTAASGSGGKAYKGTLSVPAKAPILPVKIASFDAALVANKVSLKWVSATELNANNFVIERSIDGINYTAAGTVKAIGNSLNLQVYSFSEDASALSGTVYYRLKIVDKNGAASYSDAQSVSIKSTQSSVISVYPNPLRAGQDLKVKYLASKSDKVTFTLISAAGNRVVNTAAGVNEGTNELSLNVGHLASGTYYLSTNNSTKKQAIIVQ